MRRSGVRIPLAPPSSTYTKHCQTEYAYFPLGGSPGGFCVALAVGVVAVGALASVALAVGVLAAGVPALDVLVVAGLVLSGVVVAVDVVFLGGVWEWCAGVGGEVVGEGGECPAVGGVLGEGLGDEGAADGVDVAPASLPAVTVAALFVEVAEWGAADGVAGAGFLTEAFDHFGGQVVAVELDDAAHDAVRQHAAGGRCFRWWRSGGRRCPRRLG